MSPPQARGGGQVSIGGEVAGPAASGLPQPLQLWCYVSKPMARRLAVVLCICSMLGLVHCGQPRGASEPPRAQAQYVPSGGPGGNAAGGYPPLPTPMVASSLATPPPAPPKMAVPKPAWAVANEDPTDDYRVGPPDSLPDCAARLAALSVRNKPATSPVHTEGDKTCGAPQVVSYEGSAAGITWSSPPVVTCLVAIGLARFEAIAQEEAQRLFGSPVKRIDHMGTYACRPMVRFNLASEHSFANAIDIGTFTLANGKRVSVDPDWLATTAPPSTPTSQFLRNVARRTYDEGVFSVVLGPPWDALHKNHLHLDQSRYRVDGLIVRDR